MTGSGRGRRLQGKLDLVHPALSLAGSRVLEHPQPREFYPKYIAAMHGISRAAVPLMELAVTKIRPREATEESAAAMRAYWEEHIPEESGHDVWALEDLEVIGVHRKDVLAVPPATTIAALVGAQYYWIQHVHPVALMGYLAVMESNPPSIEAVEWLERETHFPPEAFRSMRIHAKLDIFHGAEVFRVIDELPIDAAMERLITISALQTVELLTQALTELVDRSTPGGEAATAFAGLEQMRT